MTTQTTQANDYCVKLPTFEGPFDLLCQLIAKEKVEIWEISIAHIVDQYIEHLSFMEEKQAAQAGDFVLMASSLLHLKSRLLLPRLFIAPREKDDEAFYFGTKEDLVRSLLAYRRFKLMAQLLQKRERAQHGIYLRTPEGERIITINMQPSLFPYYTSERLQKAMLHLRERNNKEDKEEIVPIPEELSFRTIMHRILAALKKAGLSVFKLDEFFQGRSKKELVVSFFVFLELAKRGRLSLCQEKVFAPIRVFFPPNKECG